MKKYKKHKKLDPCVIPFSLSFFVNVCQKFCFLLCMYIPLSRYCFYYIEKDKREANNWENIFFM